MSLVETLSPEGKLFYEILDTYKQDIDSFFLFVKNCKEKNKYFDARSVTKIKRNNYFVENLTTVLNLVNTNYKTHPNIPSCNLHCELICDMAGIEYDSFREKIYYYVKFKAEESDMDIDELLVNYKTQRVLHRGNV